MNFKTTLLMVQTIFILCLMTYIVYTELAEPSAYVINQKVFDGYAGKKVLEDKLSVIRKKNKRSQDSLLVLFTRSAAAFDGTAYDEMRRKHAWQEEQLTDEFTESLWLRINNDIKAFGAEKGYAFIYGATGDGGLMYANEAYNITEDVIQYLNEKYEGD
ncbi:OmpH family outer membrane protein [Chryseolinea lacunae]|uniref:OmpH family outer membrane protein n=1 Tax=Chryseolinea lacunae TaxID=2801331 RepID=A0ABS1KZE7_9BACT|nr:OmpH family outer membrane protein [Chryseolinea lacunae]MBL0744804.1 OmpH family outer membrane protein [Chryseolinea lacunae]